MSCVICILTVFSKHCFRTEHSLSGSLLMYQPGSCFLRLWYILSVVYVPKKEFHRWIQLDSHPLPFPAHNNGQALVSYEFQQWFWNLPPSCPLSLSSLDWQLHSSEAGISLSHQLRKSPRGSYGFFFFTLFPHCAGAHPLIVFLQRAHRDEKFQILHF